jgi:hypothetical protein
MKSNCRRVPDPDLYLAAAVAVVKIEITFSLKASKI